MKILNSLKEFKNDMENYLGIAMAITVIVGIPVGVSVWVGLEINQIINAPTFYTPATISKIDIDRGSFVIAVKGEGLPLKGDVIYISSAQYATMNVGDAVCLKYKQYSKVEPQANLQIVDDAKCKK